MAAIPTKKKIQILINSIIKTIFTQAKSLYNSSTAAVPIINIIKMKYGIIINPAAGKSNRDSLHRILKRIAGIIGPDHATAGLDTQSSAEFCAAAEEISRRVDTLIVCGGDGSFFDVMNAVDREAVLAYIPLGSGNALRYALHLPRAIPDVIERIKQGTEHRLDVICCDSKKALFGSVGIDSDILRRREEYVRKGIVGLSAYARAMVKTILEGLKRLDIRIHCDDEVYDVKMAATVIISKIPYYGYGLNVIPKAKLDDGNIHLLWVNASLPGILFGLASALLGGNKTGTYRAAKQVTISSDKNMYLQMHGNLYKEAQKFIFTILPAHLRMIY